MAKGLVRVITLGRTRYREALELQLKIAENVGSQTCPHTLLVLEHFPVYTVGKRNTLHNFKVPMADLEGRGFEIHHVARGGETTFHGPGQAVLYPILKLRDLSLGARRYVEGLEDVMIRTCGKYGVACRGRLSHQTGVWVEERKIGAIGVQISKGVTMHGLAMNVTTDLSFFDAIVPCGIEGKSVTSLENEVEGGHVTFEEVQRQLVQDFCNEFELDQTPD